MKTFLLLPLLLSACTYADSMHAVAVGGKGTYKSKAFALVWDNEKSFNDAAWIATIAIPAIQAVKTAQATELTNRVQNTNQTNQAINASNNATTVATGAQNADVAKTQILNPVK